MSTTNNPPLPPTLIYPLNLQTPATEGVFLQWGYNSPYDFLPSRFDVRYRVEDGEWVELRVDAQGDFAAKTNARTQPIAAQARVEWRVRAYSVDGVVGEWSETGVFGVLGTPPTPVLTLVTNSGFPVASFSARTAAAFEMEITTNATERQTLYRSGIMPFVGELSHTVRQLIPDGNHIARLRIFNENGISSEWTERPFVVNLGAQPAVNLRTANNVEYRNVLWFDGENRDIYVYRAVASPLVSSASYHGGSNNVTNSGSGFQIIGGSSNVTNSSSDSQIIGSSTTVTKNNTSFQLIAKLHNSTKFEDWTVKPNVRYKYFVRAVSAYPQHGFVDSEVRTAKSNFMETLLAPVGDLCNAVKLLWQLDGKPTKDELISIDGAFTFFAGREKPVLNAGLALQGQGQGQAGLRAQRKFSLAFHVSLAEREKIEEIARSGLLLLRDWRLGAIYGSIRELRVASDGVNGCELSFDFVECDYNGQN